MTVPANADLKTSNSVGADRRFAIQPARRRRRESQTAVRSEGRPTAGEGAQRGGSRRQQQQASQQKLQTVVSIGATMLGALMGRRAVSLSTLGRATTAARGVGRSAKATQDVAKAQERLQEAQAELAALEAELQQAVAALRRRGPGGHRARHGRDQTKAGRRRRAPRRLEADWLVRGAGAAERLH
jgi:hypothetical protein